MDDPFPVNPGSEDGPIAADCSNGVAEARCEPRRVGHQGAPRCHRLRQCTEPNCSAVVHHRDTSAAGALAIKLALRLASASRDPKRREWAAMFIGQDNLITATPVYIQRGAKKTEQPSSPCFPPTEANDTQRKTAP